MGKKVNQFYNSSINNFSICQLLKREVKDMTQYKQLNKNLYSESLVHTPLTISFWLFWAFCSSFMISTSDWLSFLHATTGGGGAGVRGTLPPQDTPTRGGRGRVLGRSMRGRGRDFFSLLISSCSFLAKSSSVEKEIRTCASHFQNMTIKYTGDYIRLWVISGSKTESPIIEHLCKTWTQ